MGDISKEKALELWKLHFGDKSSAVDFAGRTILKSSYGDLNSSLRWEVDHSYPQSKGGSDNNENLMPCHWESNNDKDDDLEFTTNSNSFMVSESSELEGHWVYWQWNPQEKNWKFKMRTKK